MPKQADKVVECSECPRKMKASAMKRHVNVYHSAAAKRKLTCRICKRKFVGTRKDALKDHLASFHDEYDEGDKNIKSTSFSHVVRKKCNVLQACIAAEGTELKEKKALLRDAEVKLRAKLSDYSPKHDLPVDTSPEKPQTDDKKSTRKDLAEQLVAIRKELAMDWDGELAAVKAKLQAVKAKPKAVKSKSKAVKAQPKATEKRTLRQRGKTGK